MKSFRPQPRRPMRSGLLLICVGCGLMVAEQATSEPLPDGKGGIAARYPGDVGIASDPAVIFADDFESYASARNLLSKWSEVFHFTNIAITTVPANVLGGRQALELMIPRQNAEVSNHVGRYVSPSRDMLFLRYYAKFDANFDVLGSSHNGSTISARYCCPGQRADGYNKFLVSYEAGRWDTATANPGSLNVYVYHPGQRSAYGDHFYPTGRVLPFDRVRGDFGPTFVARPELIPALMRWYSYELMVKVNTPGQSDGRIGMWLDGMLIADFPNVRLRDTEALKIDRFTIDLHARSNPRAATKKWHDNVVAATSYIGPMAGR